MKNRTFWLLFVAFQAIGTALPMAVDIHGDPWWSVTGIVLLIPGIFVAGLVSFLIPNTAPAALNVAVLLVVIYPVNALAWYGLRKAAAWLAQGRYLSEETAGISEHSPST